jgi:hypothetical protein
VLTSEDRGRFDVADNPDSRATNDIRETPSF